MLLNAGLEGVTTVQSQGCGPPSCEMISLGRDTVCGQSVEILWPIKYFYTFNPTWREIKCFALLTEVKLLVLSIVFYSVNVLHSDEYPITIDLYYVWWWYDIAIKELATELRAYIVYVWWWLLLLCSELIARSWHRLHTGRRQGWDSVDQRTGSLRRLPWDIY